MQENEHDTGKTNEVPVVEKNETSQAESQSQIPEKFRGKSAEDVIKSYLELESEVGRLRNEFGMTKKERDEIYAKYAQMEQYLNAQHQQQIQDPLQVFESKFDEDPKTAIKEALRKQQELLLTQTYDQIQRLKQAQLQKIIEDAKANPDFVRRETLMQQLALRFNSLLNPQQITSPEMITLLDLASKGADLAYYEKQAIERAKKESLSARDEKLQSRSETSSSMQVGEEDLSKLSLQELEKRLERMER